MSSDDGVMSGHSPVARARDAADAGAGAVYRQRGATLSDRYPSVVLRPQRPERVGHPWVFAGEIAEIPPVVGDGDVVRVLDSRGHFTGMAYLNRASKITLRYLSRRDEQIGARWWVDRLAASVRRRRHLPHTDHTNALRLVNAEADDVPGLIVDRYADTLVVQMLALGLEPWRETIVGALQEMVTPRSIYERSDVPVRALEGLASRAGLLAGHEPPPLVEIYEGDARLLVDVREGQKTGMFLDQRRNRLAIAPYARGGRMLNCFAYSGAFGVHAGLGGAEQIVNADISVSACRLAEQNMILNGMAERHRVVADNCFDLLRAYGQQGAQFDMVVLDPPAFTKSRDTIDGALRGYKDINMRALRLLSPGGILVTCSCSQHIDDATFKAMLQDAAHDARRDLRVLEQRGQGPDHPVLLRAPETQYLICIIAEVGA